MGFRIQNNIAALNSLRFMDKNTQGMNKSLERLSSGYRINNAADDAAGLSSSMRMRAEVNSLNVASRNAAEATSLLQVAEGAMGQVDLILNRMKELATQAASGNAGADLGKIDAEAQALKTELDRIVNFTEYNDTKLLDGNFGSVTLSSTAAPAQLTAANGVEYIDVSNAKANAQYTVTQASGSSGTEIILSDGAGVTQALTFSTSLGVNQNEVLDFTQLGVKITVNSQFAAAMVAGTYTDGGGTIDTADVLGAANFQIGNKNDGNHRLGFNLSDISTTSLKGGATFSIDLSSTSTAQTALGDIDTAISHLAGKRADVGALINRLQYAQSNLAVSIENKSAAESTIRDVDMAAEMSTFTKNQILVQASTAMLAQANAAPQNVLSLIR